jgi:hypothetical protein
LELCQYYPSGTSIPAYIPPLCPGGLIMRTSFLFYTAQLKRARRNLQRVVNISISCFAAGFSGHSGNQSS